jgi:hypothetical protein
MIAVWDGAPSRGIGGTANIVTFARQQRTPRVWIHPDGADLLTFEGDWNRV